MESMSFCSCSSATRASWPMLTRATVRSSEVRLDPGRDASGVDRLGSGDIVSSSATSSSKSPETTSETTTSPRSTSTSSTGASSVGGSGCTATIARRVVASRVGRFWPTTFRFLGVDANRRDELAQIPTSRHDSKGTVSPQTRASQPCALGSDDRSSRRIRRTKRPRVRRGRPHIGRAEAPAGTRATDARAQTVGRIAGTSRLGSPRGRRDVGAGRGRGIHRWRTQGQETTR